MEFSPYHLSKIVTSLINDHRCPTPFLFLDEEEILSAHDLFETYLPQVRLFYSVKANPSSHLVRLIHKVGLSLDVASAEEIRKASALGIPGEDLYVSAPYKTEETIRALFSHKVAAVALDSLQELVRLARCRQDVPNTDSPKIFVRIRLETANVQINLNRKFGCSIKEAIVILRSAVVMGFGIGGICFHVGTQSADPANHIMGINTAMAIGQEVWRRFGIRVPVINIGGGFCDRTALAEKGLKESSYYQAIGEACSTATAAGFQLYAEPGRCLIASAGTLVTSVLGVNNKREGRLWAYLDDGVYGCYSAKLYEDPVFQFHALRESGTFLQEESYAQWCLAGPSCCSLDVITESACLPENLSVGDIIFTPNLGAYSLSTATNFNGLPIPRSYLIRAHVEETQLKIEILNEDFVTDDCPSLQSSRVAESDDHSYVHFESPKERQQ